ncbi:DegQ family serine endoprotease [Diaphorobacter aerolatus]|uniref:Probable periplasmic serine endoprotease DegP-like n=1 Tax=Diaphorobacter aerolatus TaxID=1288495 RepID=A0A7H0GHN5_9BURK|nr:DegQ family serine endoprotease [Diaphorobacter aerolatus]QNP47801.1 DegQ family serine endoprotease [Diaphorobacter aerolatus]
MNTILKTPRGLVAALVMAGVIGGAGAGLVTTHLASAQQSPAPAVATAVSAPSGAPGAATLPSFAQITSQYGPAVVNISVSGTRHASASTDDDADDDTPAAAQRQQPGMDPNDPFYQFFRQFGIPGGGGMQQRQMPRDVPVRGEGSGFIVSADGLVLTNAHVVKDAETVTVKLTDRREFKAKVLGADPKTDVAVLKIDAKDLPTVKLGDTQSINVGDWVLAIGSPFGFENSVTAGVVSAKGRSLPDDSSVPFIQTDVAVNPGNSGGPLFNARGEVVGINSQIYSRSGGYQGLSFAIPIEVASKVQSQIVKTGKVEHAKLGVTVQEVNQTLADSFGLDRPEGALVSSVEKGGPADKAGLKSGDVIRSVNGQKIIGSGDLPAMVSLATPGSKVDMQVWRQGKPEDIVATLGNASDKAVKVAGADDKVAPGKLGVALRALQPEERKQLGADGGMLIERAQGPAAKAGIQAGDVLLSINGTPARDVDQVREAIAKAGKSVALLVQRDGSRIFVPVQLG